MDVIEFDPESFGEAAAQPRPAKRAARNRPVCRRRAGRPGRGAACRMDSGIAHRRCRAAQRGSGAGGARTAPGRRHPPGRGEPPGHVGPEQPGECLPVIAVFRHRLVPPPQASEASGTWICLDSPRDPGNLGTIIRTAHAAAATGLMLLGNACDPYDARRSGQRWARSFTFPSLTSPRTGWAGLPAAAG